MTLKVPRAVFDGMIEHAKKAKPVECCGYLAGRGEDITDLYPMQNIDDSHEHFSFEPREQFKVVKMMREKGIYPMVVYHSHPETPARMSDEDIRLANDPDIFYGIVSLQFEPFDFRIFSIKEGVVQLVDYEII